MLRVVDWSVEASGATSPRSRITKMIQSNSGSLETIKMNTQIEMGYVILGINGPTTKDGPRDRLRVAIAPSSLVIGESTSPRAIILVAGILPTITPQGDHIIGMDHIIHQISLS